MRTSAEVSRVLDDCCWLFLVSLLQIDHRREGLTAEDMLELLRETSLLRPDTPIDNYGLNCMRAAVLATANEPGLRPPIRRLDGAVRLRGARALEHAVIRFNDLYQEGVDREEELEEEQQRWQHVSLCVNRQNGGKFDLPGWSRNRQTLLLREPLKKWADAEKDRNYKRTGLTAQQIVGFLIESGVDVEAVMPNEKAVELMAEAVEEIPEAEPQGQSVRQTGEREWWYARHAGNAIR